MADGGHRVADFVGKVGGQLSERGKFDGQGFRLNFALRADIEDEQLVLLLFIGTARMRAVSSGVSI